jgi:hypothetical protein
VGYLAFPPNGKVRLFCNWREIWNWKEGLPRAQDFQCVWFFPGPWLERAELDRKIQTLARWSSSSSGNLDIESFLDWIYEEEMMMDESQTSRIPIKGRSFCLLGGIKYKRIVGDKEVSQ